MGKDHAAYRCPANLLRGEEQAWRCAYSPGTQGVETGPPEHVATSTSRTDKLNSGETLTQCYEVEGGQGRHRTPLAYTCTPIHIGAAPKTKYIT